MPQFEHKDRLVNLARLELLMQQQQTAVCAAGSLYSEARAKNRLFSEPASVGPALAVSYMPGKLTLHTAMQPDGLSLTALAQDTALVSMYQTNRLYPPEIQLILKQGGSNLSGEAFTSDINASAMLATNRVDYVVEYTRAHAIR